MFPILEQIWQMKNNKNTRNITYRGLSLIELVVVFAIGLILLIITLAILGDFFRSRKVSRNLANLQVTSGNIFQGLTQEIHWSDDYYVDTNSLTLYQDEEEIYYSIVNDRLNKDGKPISPPEAIITSFKVYNRAPFESLPLLEIHLSLESVAENIPKALLETQTTISMRITSL